MRSALSASALALLLLPVLAAPADAQHRRRRQDFRHDGRIASEAPATSPGAPGLSDADRFDSATNGYLEQGPPFDELDEERSVVALRSFNDNRFIFEEVELVEDGLGPTYTCHTPALVTAPAGTPINGGEFIVPPALGSKRFHPYSDFLLHDIGTGDGIPVLPGAEYAGTASQIRTAPLWALRTRNRLMHDGLSFTKQEAIERHAGQASGVTDRYRRLSPAQQRQLLAFLDSL